MALHTLLLLTSDAVTVTPLGNMSALCDAAVLETSAHCAIS